MMERAVAGTKIRMMKGDITRIPVDVMVNAANSDLVGGGGVDGAIHRAGGPAIMLELNRIRPKNGCPTGGAVVTTAGDLPAKFVVHAVGPVWRGGRFQEDLDLASAYATSLDLACARGARTVSFPSISTGAYGYPVHKAAGVALSAVAGFLESRPGCLAGVFFVLFDEDTLKAYQKALAGLGSGGGSP
ncbi:MAG: macro domain-containing protein [Elusimicrobia bacterium]|nr:macro domain-containing protein [Elusimicrobiota bacterium]